jgi:hypothetical protein
MNNDITQALSLGKRIIFFKSLVAQYTRKDGTVVRAHSDKRVKRINPTQDDRTIDMFAAPKKPMGPSPFLDEAMKNPEKFTIDLFTGKTKADGWEKLWGGMALPPSAPAVQNPSAEQLPAKAGGNVATPSVQSLDSRLGEKTVEGKGGRQSTLIETSTGPFPSIRKVTKEGVARVNAAKAMLREIINNPDIVGKQRADRIANGKNLVAFLDTHARAGMPPMQTGYEQGNEVAYTGEDAPKGMRTFIFLEGSRAGADGVSLTKEASDESIDRNRRDRKDMQDGFSRVRDGEKSSKALHNMITVAADSIEKLRKNDVLRVLESNKRSKPLARYIADNRPDLAQEVKEVMEDEFGVKDWMAKSIPVRVLFLKSHLTSSPG